MIDTIMSRKSVRTYDGKGLSLTEINDLNDYAKNIDSPFGIPAEIRFLEAEKYGLKSPVLSGVQIYVAGKTDVEPYADVSFGYVFEKFLLKAVSMGIGTVWIAGTMNRDAFEKAIELKDNEFMPAISPLGHPAKRSLRENLMRKGVKADFRIEPSKLFFEGSFETPISETLYSEMKECLETVRWAPSAVNKQPWRVVVSDGFFHFYEHHDKGYVLANGMDLQKVDLGIAVCHFDMALEEKQISHEIIVDDPDIDLPENTEYICSFKI